MSKNIKKDELKNKIIYILGIVFIILFAFILNNKTKNSDVITKVSRVSKDKYDTIRCVNNKCNSVVVSNTKKGKINYKIYNANGKVIAKYSEDSNSKSKLLPYEVTKNYILMQKDKMSFIYNKRGKKIYESKGKLISINDNYIIEAKKSNIDYKYTILSKKGKKVYNKISEYELYNNGKLIYIRKGNKDIIFNSKMKVVLENYSVKEEIKENEKTLYMILKNSKDAMYYYFSVSKNKVLNDEFDSYSINKDNSLTIERKEKEKKVIYAVNVKGKEKRISEERYVSQYIKDIKKKVKPSDYVIYTTSLKSEKQNKIFVDSKKDNSFGIYDLKNNKYEKMYSYLTNNIYSTVTEILSNDDKVYYQISCSEPICMENKMIVYNFTDSKELFSLNGSDLVANYYTQYKNGYKVVKYSYKSENKTYKGKYVLYDAAGKELVASSNQILVIDSVPVIKGEEDSDTFVIYSSKQKKVLNDQNSLASKLDINNKTYYKYTNLKNTIVINSDGKKVYSTSNSSQFDYSNDNLFSINSKSIEIYNMNNKSTKTYKYDKNENNLDASNNKISPYGSAMFINNSNDNYIKVINSKTKVIKRIKHTKIYKVEINKEDKRAFIFTTSKINNKTKYGFYIAK